MRSALYHGFVRHRRYSPKMREFRHPVSYFYVDLAEVPARFSVRGFFSDRGPSLFGFRRRAYLGPAELPLDEAVRRRVEAESGRRPAGPIRILTQIATLGHTFNPVSFYYCFDEGDERVTDIVAEITNTPWGERHVYVLTAGASKRFEFDKRFHVSPFLGMDFRYRWSFSDPLSLLTIHMENRAPGDVGQPTFDATLTLKRSEWNARNLVAALARRPFMSFVTLALIYGHAAVIWTRRIPFVSHPSNRGEKHPRGPSLAIRASGEPL